MTELLLVKMTEEWRRALDNNLVVGVVFADFRKAFAGTPERGRAQGGLAPLALSEGGQGGGKSALSQSILYKCIYVHGTVSS